MLDTTAAGSVGAGSVLHRGDCRAVLATWEAESVDAVVCDPPYGLEFMGKEWDRPGQMGKVASFGKADGSKYRQHRGTPSWSASGNPTCENCGGDKYRNGDRKCRCDAPVFPNHAATQMQAFGEWSGSWAREVYRVMKPGAHLLAFGGTRTHHRLMCAIEDAGFELRDTLMFLYGTGFPKSLNVSKDARFCQCSTLPYDHEGTEPAAERAMRPVRGADVSAGVHTEPQRGQVLLKGVQEPSASPYGAAQDLRAHGGAAQPGMEGRRDVLQDARELHGSGVRAGAAVGEAYGAQGRVHHAAPSGDGAVVWPAPDADGSGASQQPPAGRQPARQPGVVADERGPSAGGGWPLCAGCGKQVVPQGLGTALKPSFEPIILARKPLCGTVAANVAKWGVGGLNVDGCRIDLNGGAKTTGGCAGTSALHDGGITTRAKENNTLGRWPANAIFSHSPECREVGARRVKGAHSKGRNEDTGAARSEAPQAFQFRQGAPDYTDPDGMETVAAWECADGCAVRQLDQMSGERPSGAMKPTRSTSLGYHGRGQGAVFQAAGDTGGASRFFKTVAPDAVEGREYIPYNQAIWEYEGASPATPAGSDTLPSRATTGSVSGSQQQRPPASSLPMYECGKVSTDQCQMGTASITSTTTSKTTGSTTSDLWTPPPTSACTAGANCETVSGGSRAVSAASSSPSLTSTGTSPERDGRSTDAAGHATLPGLSGISKNGEQDATRFRYVPKASTAERNAGLPPGMVSSHPTVKPLSLMRYLVRLVTPPGGLVLDPFCGSGSTGAAAVLEGFRFVGIDRDDEGTYLPVAERRIAHWAAVAAKTAAQAAAPKPAKQGRWPANVLFDREAAAVLDEQSGESSGVRPDSAIRLTHSIGGKGIYGGAGPTQTSRHMDTGGASRFFQVLDEDLALMQLPLEGLT